MTEDEIKVLRARLETRLLSEALLIWAKLKQG
jgi:hypothetical protein